MKTSAKRRSRRENIKAKATAILGGAAGAALAHTAVNAARKSSAGRDFARLPGATRAEYVAPIVLGAGVGAYVADYKRKQAMERHLARQSEVSLLTKQSSFDARQWVIDSLIR